jgi:anaerobic dimethyl sulfoxide reductase subunit A
MLVAMAHVIMKEGLQDQKFIDTYTKGFDQFKAYVLGADDGVAKTPEWAEAITGVSADTIVSLAREYSVKKPAALMSGTGPGRTAYGEQFHRATITLAAMTGNVGISGGDAAARAWESIVGGYPYKFAGALPYTINPVEEPAPYLGLWLQETYPNIHYTKIAEAILNGKKGGYPADYKMAIICNANYVNALPNINKIIKAMSALEFIVVEEQFMTATAKYADIILPTTTYMERNDLIKGVGSAFYGIQNRVIEPVGDTRSHNDIAKELAKRLNIDDYDPLSEKERLDKLLKKMNIDDVEAFKKTGVYRLPLSGSHVAYKDQIDDPDNHPFDTPSGKIEIYSQRIADMNNPQIPSVPCYIEPWEGPNDPLRKKYPLQLLTSHWKGRANCQYANIPWIREHTPQALHMNTKDADVRGIRDGDDVRVFNDRGETVIPVAVTERIMPGAVILPFGAWYTPDNEGVDRAGTSNVLTRDEPSPAGAFAYNTALVEVQKY